MTKREARACSTKTPQTGEIFHTYSAYARGLEPLIMTYTLLDLVPKGRDEDALGFSMEWLRHHDRYGTDLFLDPTQALLAAHGVARVVGIVDLRVRVGERANMSGPC